MLVAGASYVGSPLGIDASGGGPALARANRRGEKARLWSGELAERSEISRGTWPKIRSSAEGGRARREAEGAT